MTLILKYICAITAEYRRGHAWEHKAKASFSHESIVYPLPCLKVITCPPALQKNWQHSRKKFQ